MPIVNPIIILLLGNRNTKNIEHIPKMYNEKCNQFGQLSKKSAIGISGNNRLDSQSL
jgi:hypothetical protein